MIKIKEHKTISCSTALIKKSQSLKRSGLFDQIAACKREVKMWPVWMRATTVAPKWMQE